MVRTLLLAVLTLLMACNTLPHEILNQFEIDIGEERYGDTLIIRMENPLHCPLRVNVERKPELVATLSSHFPLILPPLVTDTSFIFITPTPAQEEDFSYSITFETTSDTVRTDALELPYPRGQTHRIMQGYNGKFTHFKESSRYAIDFALSVGDTICAVAEGYVIGVIDGYENGGNNPKWTPYSNFITLYHPERNLLTQYVHLMPQGSFVEVGDTVVTGQPIALSGATGYTSKPHLHFNVLDAKPGKMISIPATFGKKGLPGKELRKGMRFKHARKD